MVWCALAEGNSSNRTQHSNPSEDHPAYHPTTSQKAAAMRARNIRQEPPFNSVRLEYNAPSPLDCDPGCPRPSVDRVSSQPNATYPPTPSSVSSDARWTPPSSKIYLDIANSPSVRSAASEESFAHSNESSVNLITPPGRGRREADAGVRLAGGPIQVDGWALPPAYGDF